MAIYKTQQIRNIVLVGHGSSGKTTLAEAMLFDTGVLNRRGRVEDGTTVADWDEEAIRRGISVSSAVAPCEWQGIKVNLLDTPGFIDFVGEIKSAATVADAALVLVDAVSGVEVGTELGWGYLDERNLPRAVLVNKMDRENARFQNVLDGVRDTFGGAIVAAQLPIGEGSKFRGVVDLISMKVYTGEAGTSGDIPAEMADAVAEARLLLVEAAAEGDDELIMKYLDNVELTPEEISGGLRTGIVKGDIIPVFCASAVNNIGVRALLSALVTYMPSPADAHGFTAQRLDGEEVPLSADPAGPLAVLVFKTVADPYVGKISYYRVVSGVFHGDTRVYSLPNGNEERVSQIFMPRGKEQLQVAELMAGDIGGIAKLSNTGTNDTLCDKTNPLVLPRPVYPEPLFSVAISPKTKADSAKMGPTLTKVVEEDPTLSWRFEPGTSETILSGMGEVHIDLAVRRMEGKFGVGLLTSIPKVPYRESIARSAADYYRHKKQTGGSGQFGEVHMEIKPLERGGGFEFDTSRVFGGAISNSFFPSIEKGVKSMLDTGPIAGYPVVDVRCEVYDGKMHPVDSKDIAFQIAGREVFKKIFMAAGPVLLEPIMDVRITVPEEYMGDIMGDLNTRRGRVQGMEQGKGKGIIIAQAPLAEMQRYSIDLRSMTQGRGIYTMTLSYYEPVPSHIAEQVIAQARRDRAEAEEE
ncbi:MAG: elongation factor G [Chloroflexi bacterium HGW-Chloroflexi-1]|nr:MAG: elongation factor G [Chloroflexi bacterium HGW-Chloroflexi-1]